MIFELNNFLRKASCSANWAFLFAFQGLDNALPTVKMSTFGWTPITHLVSTNTAIQNYFFDFWLYYLSSLSFFHFWW